MLNILVHKNMRMGVKDLDRKVLEYMGILLGDNEKISIRKIARGLDMEKSLRSIQLSIKRLKEDNKIFTNAEGKIEIISKEFARNIKTRLIPLIGNIACGGPITAEEYIEDYIPVSEEIAKSTNNYFLLRTSGDSMDKKGINPGDVVLIKEQNTCKNGDIVVALIDDSATLKEFRMENGIVKLIPHSTNSENKTIIVTEDFVIQGVLEMNLGKI